MIKRSLNILKSSSFFLFGARGTGKTTLMTDFFQEEQVFAVDRLEGGLYSDYLSRPGLLGERLRIAFQTKTSELLAGKAEDQDGWRRYYSPSRTDLGRTTPAAASAAVYRQNEFLEVPYDLLAYGVPPKQPMLIRFPLGSGSSATGIWGSPVSMQGLVSSSQTHLSRAAFHLPACDLR